MATKRVHTRKKIFAADLFCGAGGTSNGLVRACDAMGIDVDLLAVNHWDTAIETHSKNHPNVKHLCMAIDKLNPIEAVPGGRLHLLVASPECTHHSRARGGKPMNDQSRATAWDILRWVDRLVIDNILIENVREFADWGPLGVDGRPMKSKKGCTFQAFLNALRDMGYRVEHRVLNAADYGDATTRERLFIIARRGNKKIVWPEATHTQKAKADTLFGAKQNWQPARNIIDWSIEGKSILDRKKPLAPSTIKRIAAGLRKFGGPNAQPFLAILRNNQTVQSIDEPLRTLTTSGGTFALCEPYILGQQSGSAPRSVNDPLPTVATDGAISLVQPFLIVNRTNNTPKSLDEPVPTICTGQHMALIEPFIVPQFGGSEPRSVDRPLGTITTTSRGVGLCEPYLLNIDHTGGNGSQVRSIDAPMCTVTTKQRTALVEPYLVPFYGERDGQDPRTHSIHEPLPTVTSHGAGGLVQPYLIPFYGNSHAQSIDDPLPTVTTKDRFGLVTIDGTQYRLDIRFRMLQPRELAGAMSFPKDYEFAGNREAVVKQIGNAVPGHLSEALCRSLLVC